MAPHTIKYALPGTKPPIFLAGSFSEPAWQPQEMQYTAKGDEYEFYKEIDVKPGGEYQYKFRVGLGDWWVLNEASPTVTDAIGNRNNLLIAPEQPQAESQEPSHTKMDGNTSPKLGAQPDTKENAAPSKPVSPVPELVVEKVDSSPSHVDDFGSEATKGQKEAHEKRTEDAEPDYVVVRAESQSPDTSSSPEKLEGAGSQSPEDVAAEVADSADAASLDQDPPTPTIADDEAGRIGFRRMSNTPIPEVAATAAEVADVAAALGDDADKVVDPAPRDKPGFQIDMPMRPTDADFEDDESSSGVATPWEDRVPKFSHEMVTPPDPDQMIPLEKVRSVHDEYKPQKSPFIEAVYDPNDPNYEEFPSDRDAILRRLSQSLRHYSDDETLYEDAPVTPVEGTHAQSDRLAPSPNMTARTEERALSLDSIPEVEDHDHRDEILASIPNAAIESKDTEVFEGVGAGNEAEAAETPKERKPSFDVHEVSPESPPTGATKEDNIENHITPTEIDTPSSSSNGVTPESGPSILVSPATPGPSMTQFGKPASEPPVNEEKVAAIEEENGRSPTGSEKPSSRDIPVEDTEPKSATGLENSPKPTNQESAKAISPEQGNGNQLKSRQKSPEQESTSTDTAKSTSVDPDSGLTSRKQVSPSQDRAPSSNSLRTSRAEVKSKNFLTSFFQLVFVDWIGGIIVQLCGGRKNALIAITAIAIIAIAYYSL